MVTTVHSKFNDIGMCMDDRRGKFVNRPNQTSETAKNYVRQHINSLETVESHYCRRDSKKLYLPHGLNLSKMYRLYLYFCNNVPPKSANIFTVKFLIPSSILVFIPL